MRRVLRSEDPMNRLRVPRLGQCVLPWLVLGLSGCEFAAEDSGHQHRVQEQQIDEVAPPLGIESHQSVRLTVKGQSVSYANYLFVRRDFFVIYDISSGFEVFLGQLVHDYDYSPPRGSPDYLETYFSPDLATNRIRINNCKILRLLPNVHFPPDWNTPRS